MIWNRQRGEMARFRHDDVTSTLANRAPSVPLKDLNDFARTQQGNLRHLDGYFDLTSLNHQWHALFGAHSQTVADCVRNVRLSLGGSPALADTAGNRRAVGNVHAVFVLINADQKFHSLLAILPANPIASSSAAPIRSSISSFLGAPRICMPSGNPLVENPHGIASDGIPSTLIARIIRVVARRTSSVTPPTSMVACPIFGAAVGVQGV